MDTVVGMRGKTKESLLVLTERKHRIEIIHLLKEHTMGCVVEKIDYLEDILKKDFSKIFKTITVDSAKMKLIEELQNSKINIENLKKIITL